MRKALSILLILSLLLCSGGGAFASGEASGGGGGALPSGGSFGDVTTGSVNNAVILINGDEVDVTEDAADVFALADGGGLGNVVSGLYLQNAGVKNSINNMTGTAQGVSGVVIVDSSAVVGGPEGYYDVDENGDPLAMPSVRAGGDYNTVILLGDEGSVFDRESAEAADGAAVAIGGGTEDDVLTVENAYLWTAGFKRTNLFADDGRVRLVVRGSRIVSPGADNYKKGWQALYGGARATLLQNGDCWFYNSSVVTEGWGALAIDSSPNLDLYAVNCDVDVLGGGYVSYTPGDGSVNFYGVDADSAQYGVFVTGNSKAYLHALSDADETATAYMTEADTEAPPVTEDGRTHINADYAAYLTHQGGGNSPTTQGYLFAENTVLSTETEYYMADNSHFLNDGYGGASWFWTEFWRGSTCLARSTNATFELDNVTLESRTGVVFRTVVNWEGASKSFTLDDETEAVGNSLILRNMDVTGDIRNDDVYRNLYVDVTDASVTGAMISATVEAWNDHFTVEALKASDAYAAALGMVESWADAIPNPTYDADYPYADFAIDLDMVSEYLTLPASSVVRGIYLTLNDGAVWTVGGDSQLVSLAVSEGAEVVFPADIGYSIYVDCDGLDPANGTAVDALPAGEYENVVIVLGDASGAPLPTVELGGEEYVRLTDLLEYAAGDEAADSPTTVLKGASIIDAAHFGEVLDVLVRDGYIIAVGDDLDGDEVIDLTGYTLMPGLIDAHVHVAGSDGYNLDLLKVWAEHGITSVREEGMLSILNEEDYIGLIEQANADPSGAYLVSCGKYFDVPGGYGQGPTKNMGVTVESAADISAELEHKAALGYPQVKIGINSDTARMTEEELIAVMETSHALGMPVAAHINYASYLEELVGYGLDEAAHTPSDEMDADLIERMVENDVYMNTSRSESYEEQKIANLRAFYEAGGVITVGTDLMRNYDTCMTALTAEMSVLTKAGLTAQEVIACATHNNALALGLDAGDILPGLQADIIAVRGSLDASFDALGSIGFVMNDGVVLVGPQ